MLVAYDLLEADGVDLRTLPQVERRARLEALVAAIDHPSLRLSPLLAADSWAAFATLRAEARARRVEGFMLKKKDARYGTGRTKDVGVWWKWKIDPLSVDAVLIYAQRGHGRRASLYTDFTFAVWDRERVPGDDAPRLLIPFAKAYSGLTDDEMVKVDAIVKKTTIEKFGPVRSVQADAGLRARLRRHPAFDAPQVRHRDAIPADAALAHRQAGRRGRHARVARGADAGRRRRGPRRGGRRRRPATDDAGDPLPTIDEAGTIEPHRVA